jgi:hypothetical protein
MAITQTPPLRLTRDQLAAFLQDHQQIKAFENLFAIVESIAPDLVQQALIAAGTAQATANDAQAQVQAAQQELEVMQAATDAKATQALDLLARIANALELLAAAPVIQNNNSVVTDYVDHRITTPVPADVPGRVYWSDDDATLDLMLLGGVTYQFGQQLDFHPKNTSGVQINKGMAVMATGVVGSSTKIECARAVANGSVPAQYMIGVATQNIPNNQFGYVAWFGSIRGFNTTGANKTVPEVWADGDILYFDPAYPGELTKNQPSAPNLDLPIAIVTNAANNGAIFVRMKTGETMNELHDVNAPAPADNDVLVYSTANSRWESTDEIVAEITNTTGRLIDSDTTLTNGAGASAGTLTNAPAAGNPTKWIPIDDNGTTRYIPAW